MHRKTLASQASTSQDGLALGSGGMGHTCAVRASRPRHVPLAMARFQAVSSCSCPSSCLVSCCNSTGTKCGTTALMKLWLTCTCTKIHAHKVCVHREKGQPQCTDWVQATVDASWPAATPCCENVAPKASCLPDAPHASCLSAAACRRLNTSPTVASQCKVCTHFVRGLILQHLHLNVTQSAPELHSLAPEATQSSSDRVLSRRLPAV